MVKLYTRTPPPSVFPSFGWRFPRGVVVQGDPELGCGFDRAEWVARVTVFLKSARQDQPASAIYPPLDSIASK